MSNHSTHTDRQSERTPRGEAPLLTASGQPIYGRIPRRLLRNPKISPEARLLWTLLEDHTSKSDDQPWPSQETLAEYMGSTDRAVRNWLNELARAGWLELLRRPGKSNRHNLIWDPPRNEGSGPPRNEGSGNPGTEVPRKKNQGEEPGEEETTPTPPEEGMEQTAMFDAPMADRPERQRRSRQRSNRELDPIAEQIFKLWWKRYPRKGRGGAGSMDRARVAWAKQIAGGATAEELDRQLTNYRLARQCFEQLTGEPCWLLAAPKFLKERRFEFDQELTEAEVIDLWNIRVQRSRKAPSAVMMDRTAHVEWMAADEAGRREIEARFEQEVVS